jgi:hypothetical protein
VRLHDSLDFRYHSIRVKRVRSSVFTSARVARNEREGYLGRRQTLVGSCHLRAIAGVLFTTIKIYFHFHFSYRENVGKLSCVFGGPNIQARRFWIECIKVRLEQLSLGMRCNIGILDEG